MDEKCFEYHRIFALVSTAMKANTVCILVNSKKCFKTLKLRLISTNDANEVSDLCCLLTYPTVVPRGII